MSEYTFGDMSYSGGQPPQQQEPQEQSPKWFRDYMTQAKAQNDALMAQVESLTAEKRNTELAEAFEAKGFTRAAAALYQGAPDKVDEWLTAYGDALAKSNQPPQQGQRPPGEMPPMQQQAPAGLPPAMQADLQKMQQMGQNYAASAQGGSDDDLAAALRATTNPDEFLQVAAAHGWQYSRDNMGMA
jgi:hypothetical protein